MTDAPIRLPGRPTTEGEKAERDIRIKMRRGSSAEKYAKRQAEYRLDWR